MTFHLRVLFLYIKCRSMPAIIAGLPVEVGTRIKLVIFAEDNGDSGTNLL